MDTTSLHAALLAAFDAVAAGSASANQRALVEATTQTLRSKINEAPLLQAVVEAMGPLADVATKPFAELNELQKWARAQQHGTDQARENPALRDMHSVYELLVSTSNHSGATIRLAPGCNVVALDDTRRRFLVPSISADVLSDVRKASTMSEAKQAARRKGAVRYHWSVERTGLVPSPREITEALPLPQDGAYMVLYAAPVHVVAKPGFIKAVEQLAAAAPVLDVLMWDNTSEPPTLWSLRGGFGHSAGDDVDWSAEYATYAKQLQTALASSAGDEE